MKISDLVKSLEKIKALQKDCGYSFKEEVNDFLKDSRNGGTAFKLEE